MVSTTLGRRNVRNYFQCCIQLEELLYDCQGYVPLTLDVMRVAFKVPLAFHTPL